MSKGKRHAAAADLYDRDHHHTGREALDLVKSFPGAKFDESVDVAIRLSVDPRKTEEMVRGTVALPAGADHVGADDLAAEVEGGMTDFDVAIASPDMMPTVGKLGRVLGPRGLMPNPKTGTVTDDVAKAVEDFKGGKVEFRTDRYGNVHVPVGKVGFEVDAIYANLQAVVDELVRLKPSTAKGRYVKKVAVSSTMGPSVRIDPASIGG
jgi:large subunit ribosomal protein L1